MGELEFNKDIKLGNEGEDVVIKDLISLGATLISKNNDNKYDFIMNFKDTQISYEVRKQTPETLNDEAVSVIDSNDEIKTRFINFINKKFA